LQWAGSCVILHGIALMRRRSSSFWDLFAPATIASDDQRRNLAIPGSGRHQSASRTRAAVLSLFALVLVPAIAHAIDLPQPVRSAETRTAQVLVVYYSSTGNTEQMARGVAEGVRRASGATAVLKKVREVSKADLEAADGIILGCPTYFANIPGEMKTILDDWNWKLKVDFTDKVGGAFATGGGQMGGQGHVISSLLLFMLHNRMVVAGPLYQNEKTGSVWAEAGAAAITGPLDSGVGEGELDGARRLGERVARLAAKLKFPSADDGRDQESGFVRLFDGKTIDGWTIECLPKDRVLATTAWTVDRGTILANTVGHPEHFYIMLVTQKEYGDFVLRLRIQVERGVTGNSGIQIRSRYNPETGWMEGPQIDINPPDPTLTGRLWNEGPGPHRWLSNDTIKGQKFYYADEGDGWNDLEITARGMKIKSVLNGVTVVDYDGSGVLDDDLHQKLRVGTRGMIGLQIHANDELKLRFKDVLIQPL
jgi:multimeric flavodoxin WrbA